jgi:hypothetical protein
MRHSDKGETTHYNNNDVFGVNFHEIAEKEQNSNLFELASEYGLSLREVKKLKKQLNRS